VIMADNNIPADRFNAIASAAANGDIATVLDFFVDYHDYPAIYKYFEDLKIRPENTARENACLFVTYKNYFNKWDDYVKFTELKKDSLNVQQFEMAADTIAAGDTATLKGLLRQNPELVYA